MSQGEILAFDPSKRLFTIRGPKRGDLTAEPRGSYRRTRQANVCWFGTSRVPIWEKEGPGGVVPVHSLKDGMVGAEPVEPPGKQPALAASVILAGAKEIRRAESVAVAFTLWCHYTFQDSCG